MAKNNTLAKPVSTKMKLGYGVGAIGLDMSYGLCISFFLNYTTDVLYVNPAFMGLMMAFARVWDGVNDPMMGVIVSNTKTKFGRFRPWIALGAMLNAIVLFMMFTNPGFTVSQTKNGIGMLIYITVFYVLWGMTYTMIDIPYWSFVPALTNDPLERNVVASVPRFFSGVGQLTVMGATPLILKLFSPAEQGKAHSLIALLLGIMFVAFAMTTFFTTKERIIPQQNEPFKFRNVIPTVRANDQLQVFLVIAITFNLGWYLVNGLAIYFFKYIAENRDFLTIFAAVSGAGQAIGLFFLSFLSKRIGKENVVRLSILTAIFGYLGMLLISTRANLNMVLFFVFDFIAALGIGCMFTAEASMLGDIVDYGEYKTGKRSDAVTFSMKSFQMKFAQTVQALIIGAGLSLSKYQENIVPQPQSGKNGIIVMMFIIPPLFALFTFFYFNKKYKLNTEMVNKVAKAMQEKHVIND